MPPAFITAPSSLLDFSMKVVHSARGIHVTPKPRCFMKSLNSALLCTFSSATSNLSETSLGSPFGATIPRQAASVQSLPVAAFSVGTLG